VTPQRLAWWHRHVREVHVWTINEASEQLELLRRGVDGIVTDRSDIGMRVLREYLAE
jgi:glycerophosphoryl diester phosphodiesterase